METIDKSHFENVCRTCLREEPVMKELFGNESHIPAFHELIMSCTSVMVYIRNHNNISQFMYMCFN